MTSGHTKPRFTVDAMWSDAAWMVGLVAAGALLAVLAGHLIAVRGGVGFDGRTYAQVVAAFPDDVSEVVSAYRAWRVGPSLLVAVAMEAMGLDRADPGQIVVAFRLLNLTVAVGAVMAWVAIARTLRLGRPALWFGFVSLFGGFGLAVFPWVNPVTTDTAGFTLGLLLLLAYLRDRRWAVAAIGLIAAFVWQLVFIAAIVLLVLPRSWGGHSRPEERPPARRLAVAAGLLAAALALAAHLANPEGSVSAPWVTGIPVALVIVGWWVATLAAPLLAPIVRLRTRDLFNAPAVVGLLAAVAIAVVAAGTHDLVSSPGAAGPSVLTVIEQSLVQAVARPAQFLVAHVAYLGPWVLVAVFLWPRVARHAIRLGPSFTVLVLVTGLLALGSESRILIATAGLFVIPTARAIDDLHVEGRWIAACGAVSVLWSGIWIDAGRVYPQRNYFSRFGPWMTLEEWAWFAVATVVTGVVMWAVLRRRSSEPVGRRDVAKVSSGHPDPNLSGGNVPSDDGPHADLAPPSD